MERTSICVACESYDVRPVSLSVDPACRSDREADALCAVHRARCTEGYCVLCGRREPWASRWPGSAIGACRPCHRATFGEAESAAVEVEFARRRAAALPRRERVWDSRDVAL